MPELDTLTSPLSAFGLQLVEIIDIQIGNTNWQTDTTYSDLSEFNNDVGFITSSAIADFETTTELNNRDSANRDRANHTGTQPFSTIDEISLTTLTTGEVLQYDGANIINASLGIADISDSGALAGLDEITDSEVATGAAIALSKLATDPLARANHTGTQTLATISDAGDVASKGITGLDNNAITGTAGTAGNLLEWNADGDAVDSGNSASLVASALQNLVEDATPQLGGTLESQQNIIRDFTNNVIIKTGTSETALLEDTGNIIEFDNSSAITYDLPNTLPKGWQITATQVNSGDVTFSPATGAGLQNRSDHTKTGGQWAMISLYVRSNSDGSSAEYILSGDTQP